MTLLQCCADEICILARKLPRQFFQSFRQSVPHRKILCHETAVLRQNPFCNTNLLQWRNGLPSCGPLTFRQIEDPTQSCSYVIFLNSPTSHCCQTVAHSLSAHLSSLCALTVLCASPFCRNVSLWPCTSRRPHATQCLAHCPYHSGTVVS